MKTLGLLWLVFASLTSAAASKETTGKIPVRDLDIRSAFRVSSEPLTTEKVAGLDPSQDNPHLQSWIVSRHAELMGLKAMPQPKGRYGVTASGIQALAVGFLRGKGPWYQEESKFTCEKNPDSWFGTEEGARKALGVAGTLWSEVLSSQKWDLALRLNRISESTEAVALDQAEIVFRQWLRKMDEVWRAKATSLARNEEWNFYWAEAKADGLCAGKPKQLATPPSIQSRMEPVPAGKPPAVSDLLARAPSRLWDGNFSVRLNISVGGKNLNGRFLIDPHAPLSVIDPTWLENQGMLPSLLKIPGEPPGKVELTPFNDQGPRKALAPKIRVGRVEMSNFVLPIRDFLLYDTEFFGPPENVATCCDGVLGQDFLKHYPVEFDPKAPSEVRVWPVENFHWSPEVPWVEIHNLKDTPLVGRGRYTIDIPHGRLWLSPEHSKQGPKKNASGLTLAFEEVGGERVLFVKDIKSRSPAQALLKEGLRQGMSISHVDGKLVAEMDQWEIDRRLAGELSDTVVLRWQTQHGTKIAPFRVKS